MLVFSANWNPVAQPHEIGDGSATLKRMRALFSFGNLGADPGGPRGCHPINGANNVAQHLHTSNKSHDIWLVSPRHLRASVHPFVYFTAPHPLFLSLARIARHDSCSMSRALSTCTIVTRRVAQLSPPS